MPLPPDAEDLAALAAGGDPASLNTLLQAIRPEVLRRCGRFLPNRHDAEEAAQDVLLQVAQNITSFEQRSLFTTWLHTVVANCARQKYRELKRRWAELPLSIEALYPPEPRTTSVIAGHRVDLLEALDRLERDYPSLALPLIYRDICRMSYAEIAERTELPLGTVKSRISAARRHVRQWLA
ncbi:MAG: RNA polymerase sigma factor [Streptomyces sp.]|uniref:RNA polymerase sigma factor n=1 Tax=Streptomyces sp. TaxID=1931 RepID=UPI0025D91750|nr:RNA polymerase sigma factor [Streptomyces sp.]MBW8794023.1 RNA polymerase sigma factor [Streptomyces sp.]